LSDSPILRFLDNPLCRRRLRRVPVVCTDLRRDDDLCFLDVFDFLIDFTALARRFTLPRFLREDRADDSAFATFFWVAILFFRTADLVRRLAVFSPDFTICCPFVCIDFAIFVPCFFASCFTSLLPRFATVFSPVDKISPIPDPTLLPQPDVARLAVRINGGGVQMLGLQGPKLLRRPRPRVFLLHRRYRLPILLLLPFGIYRDNMTSLDDMLVSVANSYGGKLHLGVMDIQLIVREKK